MSVSSYLVFTDVLGLREYVGLLLFEPEGLCGDEYHRAATKTRSKREGERQCSEAGWFISNTNRTSSGFEEITPIRTFPEFERFRFNLLLEAKCARASRKLGGDVRGITCSAIIGRRSFLTLVFVTQQESNDSLRRCTRFSFIDFVACPTAVASPASYLCLARTQNFPNVSSLAGHAALEVLAIRAPAKI